MNARRQCLLAVVTSALITITSPVIAACPTTKTCTIIDDSSKINATLVASIEQPTTIDQLRSALAKAQSRGLKVSIAGSLQSQGGQAFDDDVQVIDMTAYNKIIDINVALKTVTVQSGARWSDVITAINQQALSPTVMQDYSLFTIGGSLSGDIHGADWRFGSLSATVLSFRIMLYDGTIVNASKTENTELFYLAIGGLGLLGVITDATLQLTSNVLVQPEIKVIPTESYPNYFLGCIKTDPCAQLHYAYLSICTFKNVIAITQRVFIGLPREELFCLQETAFPAIKAGYTDLIRNNLLFKCLANVPGIIISGKTNRLTDLNGVISRNNVLNQSYAPYVNRSACTTDLIQEYFVGAEQFESMICKIGQVVQDNNVNVLSIIIRYVPASKDTSLNYAKRDLFGIQMTFTTSTDDNAIAQVTCWAQQLISTAIALGGTYSLNYELFASNRQIRAAYPDLDTFFARKKFYDPTELFVNKFYKKYRLCIT